MMAIVDQDPETSDLNTVLKLHPEIARFALEYRQVLFCFDADHLKNRHVRQAEIRAFMLFYGARHRRLSADYTWPLEEGKGIDDYLAGKAANDPEKQKEAFTELCNDKRFSLSSRRSTVEISTLVRKEFHRTQDRSSPVQELAKALAKQLNIAITDLILFSGGPQQVCQAIPERG